MALTDQFQAEVEEVSARPGSIRITGALTGQVPEADRPWRLRLTSTEHERQSERWQSLLRRPLARRSLARRAASRDYAVTVAGRRFAAEVPISDFAGHSAWDAYLLAGPDVAVPLARQAGRAASLSTQTTAEREPLVVSPHFTERGRLAIRARRAVMTRDSDE